MRRVTDRKRISEVRTAVPPVGVYLRIAGAGWWMDRTRRRTRFRNIAPFLVIPINKQNSRLISFQIILVEKNRGSVDRGVPYLHQPRFSFKGERGHVRNQEIAHSAHPAGPGSATKKVPTFQDLLSAYIAL